MLLSQISACCKVFSVCLIVFYFVTLAILLMSVGKLYFQLSNCNVVFVTLAYVIMVFNCIPSSFKY